MTFPGDCATLAARVAQTDAASPRSSWPLVALLSATATASYLCRVNISVTGALVMGEFGLSQIDMGRVFSAFVLGYALTQIPGGMLADRWGTRRLLLASAWAWACVTALQAAIGVGPFVAAPAAMAAVLLASRFALGVSEAPTFPAAAKGVARWVPQGQQGRANGCVLGAIAIGSAMAPPLLSFVMVRWGWRVALLVSALPALAVALAWLKIAEPIATARPTSSSPPAGPSFRQLRSPSFLLLTSSYTLQGYVGYIFVFWFYLYLVQERHFDLLRSGLLASLPWVLSLVSIPLGGLVSDRLAAGRLGRVWGRRFVPIVGLAAAGAGTAIGARTANPYVAALALALATASVLSVEGPFWATMMEIEGAQTGTAGGVMNMGSNIGGFISPALTPVLAARFGWTTALYVSAALAAIAAAMWFGISIPSEETDEP